MRALVLAHDAMSVAGMIGERLVERGIEVHTFVVCPDPGRPHEHAPLPDLDGYDLIVPMGSIWSVDDVDTIGAWIGDELDLLRRADAEGRPVLGICFGGQALATALGGRVERAPRPEIGWFEIEPTVEGVVPPGPWMQWHYDRFEVPPGAELLARSDVGPQLYRIGRNVGTQFHPEVDPAHLERWLSMASPEVLAGIDVDAIRADTRHHETAARRRCAALVDWFLDEVSGLGAQLPPAPPPR